MLPCCETKGNGQFAKRASTSKTLLVRQFCCWELVRSDVKQTKPENVPMPFSQLFGMPIKTSNGDNGGSYCGGIPD